MFEDALEDRLTLVKQDGSILREGIPALVSSGKIQIHDATLPIEVGDHLLRNLPSGLVEDFVVVDPELHRGLGMAIFIVKVRRSNSGPLQRQAVVHNITNHFHGSNARANVNSTDNSVNSVNTATIEDLAAFATQVRAHVGLLPPTSQSEIGLPLSQIESEIAAGRALSPRTSAALHSMRAVAEGLTGNLTAAGIVALIRTLGN